MQDAVSSLVSDTQNKLIIKPILIGNGNVFPGQPLCVSVCISNIFFTFEITVENKCPL